jgi:hypothetical protein
MSYDRVERRRCGSTLLKTSSFSMNLYSTKKQDGDIVSTDQLVKISAIPLTFSEAVYEVSVLL